MAVHDPITLASLFDGIGGFPYAASFYGIRSLWASEIVPECVSVTRRHFPDMVHMGDITLLHGGALPPVDIVTFGSPCQGLSVSGQRLGLADERSGLFLEAIRIIDEMREATHGEYPKYALFENVPGALSSAGGFDYQVVLQSFTKAQIPMPPSGKWANAGMVRGGGVDLAWCVYDAQHFGTAQRRRRLFLVCDFAGECAGEILFVPKSLRGYFEAGGAPEQGLAAFAESGPDAAGGGIASLNSRLAEPLCMGTSQANASILAGQSPTLTCAHGQVPILVHPQIAGTLCASGAGLSRPAGMKSETDFCVTSVEFCESGSADNQNSGRIRFCLRRLSPLEAERLMGFPDFWTEYGHDGRSISETKRYSMLGNSVCTPCVAYIMQGIQQVLQRRN